MSVIATPSTMPRIVSSDRGATSDELMERPPGPEIQAR